MDIPVPDLDRFSLHLTVHIKPEDVPEFFQAFKIVYDKVIEEPELLYMEVFQDPENPGTLSWMENWNKSPANFMKENLPKEYYKALFEATEPMFVKPREWRILKRLGEPYVHSRPENLK